MITLWYHYVMLYAEWFKISFRVFNYTFDFVQYILCRLFLSITRHRVQAGDVAHISISVHYILVIT